MTAHRRGTKVRQRGWHGYVYKVNAIVWDVVTAHRRGATSTSERLAWLYMYKVNAIV